MLTCEQRIVPLDFPPSKPPISAPISIIHPLLALTLGVLLRLKLDPHDLALCRPKFQAEVPFLSSRRSSRCRVSRVAFMSSRPIEGQTQKVASSAFVACHFPVVDLPAYLLQPLHALTSHLPATYRICNPNFNYESSRNPRRVLTKPSKGTKNDGYDNEDSDYILYVNDILGSEEAGHKYAVWIPSSPGFSSLTVASQEPLPYSRCTRSRYLRSGCEMSKSENSRSCGG